MTIPDRRDAATRAVDKLITQGLVDEFQKYNIAQVIRAEYEKEREQLETLLQAAVCPECDGSGAVVQEREYTVPRCCGRALPNGDCCGTPEPDVAIESVIEPCQWHSERAAILGESKP